MSHYHLKHTNMPKPTAKISIIYILALLLNLLLGGCSSSETYKYKIGVSQCVGGPWREKANTEMLSAQHLYDTDVKVTITNANNNTPLQRKQIDSLLNAGVDLLIISPNEYNALSPCVERAYRMGVPVILFDRKTSSQHYTAFIGGNNIEAGRAMGQYAVNLCKDSLHIAGRKPSVLEITGQLVMSPDRERYIGFSGVLAKHPDINFHHVETNWSEQQSYNVTKQWLKAGKPLDVVYCQNDNATFGAYKAAREMKKEKQIRFLGTDALPGEGIEAIQQGKLDASYIYPTHGEEVIELAIKILEHKPYKRENILQGYVVTPGNVEDIALNSHALMKQNKYLITIQNKLENYLGLYHAQRTVIFVAIVVAILLLMTVLLAWRSIVAIRRANRRMKEMSKEQTRFYTNASHQLRTPLTLIDGPLRKLSESNSIKESDRQLLDIALRNAHQLATQISDVLHFQQEMHRMQADNVAADKATEISRKAVQDGQRALVLRERGTELATVLVVDDNEDMRHYVRSLLIDQYYVLEAPDGKSGLKLAQESLPDLILTDVMMPVMNGLTFCARIKSDPLTSHIPVILLTARSSENQLAEGLNKGADAYLTKPFNANVLLAQIESLLSNRRKLKLAYGNTTDADYTHKDSKEEERLSPPDMQFMNALRQSVKKNMGNAQLKMDDLGADMGISRVQLYRKVKALTGLSPVELLRQMRLQKAYNLLLRTDHTVAEVAYEVGFGTPGYFSSCFKKQFGKYPTEIRNHNDTEEDTDNLAQ